MFEHFKKFDVNKDFHLDCDEVRYEIQSVCYFCEENIRPNAKESVQHPKILIVLTLIGLGHNLLYDYI